MKSKYLLIFREVNDPAPWSEEYEFENDYTDEDVIDYAKDIILRFNNHLKPNEAARKLLRVQSVVRGKTKTIYTA